MKALVLEQPNQFVYREVDTPSPGKGEVLIRIKACAVCGSDVHGMDGSTGRRRPPIIMGHEASGVVEQLGECVEGVNIGDRVTFDSTVYCNHCTACKSGDINLCANRKVLGVSCAEYKLDGAFAEYVVVPEYILYHIPDGVTFEEAAMVEPLSVAYHAATRVQIRKGASVVIVGVGTIGMLILQVVRSMGASTIIAVDLDAHKLRAAIAAGATATVNAADQDAKEQILHFYPDGQGVDYAFDATGVSPTMALCIESLHFNGTVVLVGNVAPKVDFPLQKVVTRQLRLVGSCASAGEYPQCLDLIAQGKVDVKGIISKSVPLRDGHEWIKRVYDKEKGLNKIVLIP